MNSPLLENCLREEATEHLRQLLLRHLSEWKAGPATGKRTFEFNRLNVTIDVDRKQVTLEDDFDVGHQDMLSSNKSMQATYETHVPDGRR